jgi:ribosomal protein S18 acetylase RimI-like enzyme
MVSSGLERGNPTRRLPRIRRVQESDLDAYRTLRLTSLKVDPLAFGSTWEKEAQYDTARWVDRVLRGSASASEAAWVAEAEGGRLVGMNGAALLEGSFHVFGMWVDPEYRGRGVGGALLDALLRWTESRDRTTAVVLSVNPTQLTAVRLYLSRGFRPTGVVEPLGHTPGAVVHEMRRG